MTMDWEMMLKAKDASREGYAQMRLATLNDIDSILRLFYKEGWIEFGRDDLEFIIKTSPRTNFKNVLDGKIVGAVLAAKSFKNIYYPSSRLIDKQFRKKVKYHEEGIEFIREIGRLSELEVIFSAQRLVDKYSGLYGYKPISEYVKVQVSANYCAVSPPDVTEIGVSDYHAVSSFVEHVYKDGRSNLFEHFLRRGARAFAAVDAGGNVSGCTMVRHLPLAVAMGPLIASDGDTAARLIGAASIAYPDTALQLDCAESRVQSFFKEHQIPISVGESRMTKMYRGNEELLENEKNIYAVFAHYFT